MPSVSASGTYTLTGAEVNVATLAANYVAMVRMDLNALAAGDIVVAKIKSRILTGGTDRIVWQETFSGVQTDPIKLSIPVASPFNLIFTLQQTVGTFRDVPWDLDVIA